MKIVDRYLLHGFFAKTGLMIFLLSGVYVLSEALKQSRKLGEAGIGLLDLAQYLALRIPGIVYEMAPFGVLLGTLVLLGDLARHAELAALRAGGLSLARIAVPLVLGGVVVAGLSFVVNDRVAGRLDYLGEQALRGGGGEGERGQWLPSGGIWFRDGPYVVSVDQVRRSGRELRGARLYRLGEGGLISEVISGRALVFRDGRWHLEGGNMVDLGSLSREAFGARAMSLRAEPEVMADLGRQPERMTFARLWRYTAQLQRQGQPVGFLLFTLWQKITLPLACAVMVLVAAPFVTLSPRSGGRIGRVLAGIGLGLAFHASNVLVENLSAAGGVPAVAAAWAPLGAFGALGGFLLYRHR